MSWWKSLFDISNSRTNESPRIDDESCTIEHLEINPATGLPMTDGIGSIDVGGDVYGSSTIQDSLFDDNHSSNSDPFGDY